MWRLSGSSTLMPLPFRPIRFRFGGHVTYTSDMDKLTVVDMDTVTAVLGVTEKTVRTWVNDFGCPSTKDGRSRTFYWPDVLNWYVGYAASKQNGVTGDFATDAEPEEKENIAQAMLRKTVAEANLKDLALSRMRGETINIGDAKIRVERAFSNLRSALLAMAPKLGTRLVGIKDPVQIEAICKEEMEALCRELSTGQVVGIKEDEEEAGEKVDELQASAADDIMAEELLESIAQTLVDSYVTLAAAEDTYYASIGE